MSDPYVPMIDATFVVMPRNLTNFCHVYEEVLTQCVLEHPDDYDFAVTSVPMVVCRMRWAFNDGTFNHVSRSIKATCKKMGIKYSRKAMLEYFDG